jgi:hypothetical protein
MRRQGAGFTANVDAWLGTSYSWCWVEDSVSKVRDSNRGTAWETYLYDGKGAPVEGARSLLVRDIGTNMTTDMGSSRKVCMSAWVH